MLLTLLEGTLDLAVGCFPAMLLGYTLVKGTVDLTIWGFPTLFSGVTLVEGHATTDRSATAGIVSVNPMFSLLWL